MNRTVFLHTHVYTWYEDKESTEINYPQLSFLGDVSSVYEEMLQEHMDATARQLFGDDVMFILEPSACVPCQTIGVYRIEGFGIISYMLPIVLDNTKFEEQYEITAIFPQYGFSPFSKGNYFIDSEQYPIPPEEQPEYFRSLPRHTITIQEAGTVRLSTMPTSCPTRRALLKEVYPVR